MEQKQSYVNSGTYFYYFRVIFRKTGLISNAICLVTEEEIRNGIMNEKDADLKCVVFCRNIIGLDYSKPDEDMKSFIETEKQQNDLLQSIKEIVKKKLTNENIFEFEVR